MTKYKLSKTISHFVLHILCNIVLFVYLKSLLNNINQKYCNMKKNLLTLVMASMMLCPMGAAVPVFRRL